MAAQGAGIGQQERTKGTQQLWDYANSSQVPTAHRYPICSVICSRESLLITSHSWHYIGANQLTLVLLSFFVSVVPSPTTTVVRMSHAFDHRTVVCRLVNPQGESLEPGVAMQKVQEEAETTLGMLAFDAFPRFLKSKFCNAVMDDLKKASNPNEVCWRTLSETDSQLHSLCYILVIGT